MRLELLRDGVVVRVVRVTTDPVSLGRDPSNDLVLTDPDISAHHAVITPDGLRLRDLRSTNGTFHNDVRVESEAALADGDRIRLANNCHLRVRAEVASQPAFGLLDATSGTYHRLDAERTVIGSEPGSAVELPEGPALAAAVVVGEDELWLEVPGAEDRRLVHGDTFEVSGHRFEVRATNPMRAKKTVLDTEPSAAPYTLSVDLAAPGGPIARLSDPRRNTNHAVTAENRATLLFVLARRRKLDLERGVDSRDAGWVDDEEVILGVWGRGATQKPGSNYSVLVHRLRREIEEAGFASQLLQKRRGALRVVVDGIDLGDPT